MLLQAVVRPHRLVKIERVKADGTTIECYAEYAGSISPTSIAQKGIKAQIDFKVPDGVWRGQAVVSASTVAGAALSQTLALPGLAKSTAAIEDGQFTIYGPVTSPIVVDRTDGVDGESFKYDAVVPNGQSLIVDSRTWAVTGGGGLVVNQAKVFPAGRRLLTVVHPRPGLNPTIQLRGSGGGAATRLAYSAYPTFAC